MRLKSEAEGLRTLLLGLVGGPELLREWEKEWRERFGGEEADEVDEDAEDNEEGDADADDGDDAEDGDSDDEDGRVKKRARLERKERKQKTTATPGTEKRKRGRPRKNPVLDAPTINQPHLVLQPPDVAVQRQPSSYLLAAFLLFSFFNPSIPPPTRNEAQEGMVLSHTLPNAAPVAVGATGWDALQAMNMLVSVLLLVSLLGPYIPKRITRLLPDMLLFGSVSTSNSPSEAQKTGRHGTSLSPTQDAEMSRALVSRDELALRRALGAEGDLSTLMKSVGSATLRSMKDALHISGKAVQGVVSRHDELELQSWRRLSQIEVLRGKPFYANSQGYPLIVTPGENMSLLSKIQAYLSFSSRLPFSASPSDRITLALLAHAFAASTASKIWDTARRSDNKTSSETLVLDMDIEDAAKIVSTTQIPPNLSNEDSFSPAHRIATRVILTRTKTLAARQFVSSVSGQRPVNLDNEAKDRAATLLSQDKEAKTIVAAGKELGGLLGELTRLLDKVDRCPAAEVLATLPPHEFEFEHDDESSSSLENSTETAGKSTDAPVEDTVKDTRLLLLATLLYRRIFPAEAASCAHVLSPPPSPTTKSADLHLALRRTLASTAFDADPETEDARDRVVDILAAMRRGRAGVLY